MTNNAPETQSDSTITSISRSLLPRLLAFPLFAFFGQWFWMTTYFPASVISCVFWIPALTYSWFCVGGLSHELAHHNLPLSRRASEFIGRVIGTLIGIPYTVYREVHLRHHAYLNTPLDWELWPYSDPKASLGFRRAFIWIHMLAGSAVTPIIWGRIYFSPYTPVKKSLRRKMWNEYLVMAAFWGGVGVFTWHLHSSRQFEFRTEQWLYAVPLLLAGNCNSIRTIMEHIGTRSFDPLQGTRTVVGTNIITRVLSYFDFDLAVHGPHHRYPKLQHGSLKSRMAEIQQTAPDEKYPVFDNFRLALVDTFRTAIRNPGVGVNAGCTDDLSHLPGMSESQAPDNGQHISYADEAVVND